MLLSEFSCSGQEQACRDNDAAIVGHLLNRRQQWGDRLRCAPGPHRDVGYLVADQVESGESSRRVDQEGTRWLIVIVLGIEGREEDAGIEQQRRHGLGRVSFTLAAEPPP